MIGSGALARGVRRGSRPPSWPWFAVATDRTYWPWLSNPVGVSVWAAAETSAPWLAGCSAAASEAGGAGVGVGRLVLRRLIGVGSGGVAVRAGGRRRHGDRLARRVGGSLEPGPGGVGHRVAGWIGSAGERDPGREAKDRDGDEDSPGGAHEPCHARDNEPAAAAVRPIDVPSRRVVMPTATQSQATPSAADADRLRLPGPLSSAGRETPRGERREDRHERDGADDRELARRRPGDRRRHERHEPTATSSPTWTSHARSAPSRVAIEATPAGRVPLHVDEGVADREGRARRDGRRHEHDEGARHRAGRHRPSRTPAAAPPRARTAATTRRSPSAGGRRRARSRGRARRSPPSRGSPPPPPPTARSRRPPRPPRRATRPGATRARPGSACAGFAPGVGRRVDEVVDRPDRGLAGGHRDAEGERVARRGPGDEGERGRGDAVEERRERMGQPDEARRPGRERRSASPTRRGRRRVRRRRARRSSRRGTR